MTAALEHIRTLVAEYDAQDPLRREPCRMLAVEQLRELIVQIERYDEEADQAVTLLQAAAPHEIAPWAELPEAARIAAELLDELDSLRAERDRYLEQLRARDGELRRAEERLEDLQSKLAARGVTL